jgi:hypothetical protein
MFALRQVVSPTRETERHFSHAWLPNESTATAQIARVLKVLERFFGCEFNDVAISLSHAPADQSYAEGSHVSLGMGEKQTHFGFLLALLAHELSHVLQFRAGAAIGAAPCCLSLKELERQAQWVAGAAVRGLTLPKNYRFLPAHHGQRLFHKCGGTCPGVPIDASDRTLWMPANQVIELAYVNDPAIRGHADAVFFGSQFENADVLLPKGAPNKAYGNLLLQNLRGISRQYRPDIIDFHDRVFYEIKTREDGKSRGQIESYYRVAEEIRRQHASFREPPWKVEYATWYPAHILPFPPDPLKLFVCTQATDHDTAPGLIIYDIRRKSRRDEEEDQKTQQASRYDVVDVSPSFAEMLPKLREEMGRRIPRFDPNSPEYVIIAPRELYDPLQSQWNKQRLRPMQIRAPIGSAVFQGIAVALAYTAIVAGVVAICVVGAVVLIEIAAVAAAATATAEVAATASTAIEVIEIGEIAAGAAGTATTAAASTAAADTAAVAAYQAMLTSQAVRSVAIAAGTGAVVIVTFTGAPASAATRQLRVRDVFPIRIVPATEFSTDGVPTAWSKKSPLKFQVCLDSSAVARRFSPGVKVTYDGQAYNVIALTTVR